MLGNEYLLAEQMMEKPYDGLKLLKATDFDVSSLSTISLTFSPILQIEGPELCLGILCVRSGRLSIRPSQLGLPVIDISNLGS